jgi:hypothetical protein
LHWASEKKRELANSTSTRRPVTSYSITSANDMPTRDPATWELQGSNDGQSWTVVDARTGETFASRFLTKTYLSLAPAPYGRYRLNVTANAGASALQAVTWPYARSDDRSGSENLTE